MLGRLAVWMLTGALLLVVTPTKPAVSTPRPSAADMALAASGDNQCWNYKTSEKGFARKINQARENNGLPRLSIDPEISKPARVHTDEMVSRNTLYHTSSTDLRNRVTSWSVLGENVGVGSTVSSLHEAFMNSPAHRDNILLPSYRHVGVGVKKKDGRMWVTVIFESVTDPGTTLRMPRC